jgi:hypothetical protein
MTWKQNDSNYSYRHVHRKGSLFRLSLQVRLGTGSASLHHASALTGRLLVTR